MSDGLRPYLVADRPMSLRFLEGLRLSKYPVKLGIMTHANVTKRFMRMIADFPCIDKDYCGVVDGGCPFDSETTDGRLSQCGKGQMVEGSFDIMADSGVFQKGGCMLTYSELFQRYQFMGVSKGVMIDSLNDAEGTIESAREAMAEFRKSEYDFELIGVAQGNTPEEYLHCYETLRDDIGFTKIAIGGLLSQTGSRLRRRVRISQVERIIKPISSHYSNDWMFALGVYHPTRHEKLESLGVQGSDFSGWMFQYTPRGEGKIARHINRRNQTRTYVESMIMSQCKTSEALPVISFSMPSEVTEARLPEKGAKKKERVDEKIPNNLVESFTSKDESDVTIISCGYKKADAERIQARNAYLGKVFKSKRTLAESSGDDWMILSGKLGLLWPTEEIDPNYDITIRTVSQAESLSEVIKAQLEEKVKIGRGTRIDFFGPKRYFEALVLAFSDRPDVQLVHPTAGLRQGEAYSKILRLTAMNDKS